MPSRIVCVAILIYWVVAALGLVSRDLLPELSIGALPDLRTIASAGGNTAPVRWNILVADKPNDPEARCSVGQAVTESKRTLDGWIDMKSTVIFDSGRLLSGLLKGGPQTGSMADEKIEFLSLYRVDPSGNLRSFHSEVRLAASSTVFLEINGKLKNRVMEVVTKGALPVLNRSMSFEYNDRGVVQSQLGPLDRLPGLAVGQRWDERIASPFSGQIELVRAEVTRKVVTHWDLSPVTALEVVHRSKAVTARTWVRPDGVVLRQEVALPMLRLVLERMPDGIKSPPLTGPTPATTAVEVPLR